VNRETLRVAVVAVLCVAALGAAAATLDSARSTGGGVGPSDAGGEGFDDDPGNAPLPLEDVGAGGGDFGGSFCWPFLTSPEFFALAAGVAGAVFGVTAWRRDVLVGGATVVSLGLPAFLLWLLLAPCNTGSGEQFALGGRAGGNNSSMAQGGGMIGEATGEVPASPSLLLVALLAVAVVAAAAAVVVGSGDDAVVHDDEPVPEEEEQRRAALGAVAGEAADRIAADGDVDNEVFRAWRRMVDLLDVEDPETTTPGEFAAAAVDAGVDADDAGELTRLFEDVRYGDADPTGDREERAVAALRRIEGEYADEGDRR